MNCGWLIFQRKSVVKFFKEKIVSISPQGLAGRVRATEPPYPES